jgi:non-ribosomal peptide synthase protein (TIGR01720 family)
VLLELRFPLNWALLESALQLVVRHHDALRLAFEKSAVGWQQRSTPPRASIPELVRVDLSRVARPEQGRAIEERAAEEQAAFELGSGVLLRGVLFDLGPALPCRLLLAAHHLAVDGYSWRVLMEDLWTAYTRLSRGEPMDFPPKTTSFSTWSRTLEDHAQSPALARELDYWLGVGEPPVRALPRDLVAEADENTAGSVETLSVSLEEAETRHLLHEALQAHGAQINDLLLTALGAALTEWTHESSYLLDLEGHGREDLFDGIDLSRTVGWFTSVFPVRLKVRADARLTETLQETGAMLRQIPNRGLGYGLLRYIRRDEGIRLALSRMPQPEISFNYLGQFGQAGSGSSSIVAAKESMGPFRSPRMQRRYLLEITGSVSDGVLKMHWLYSRNFHRRSTVEGLAQTWLSTLRALIWEGNADSGPGSGAGMFPRSGLSSRELERLLGDLGQRNEKRSES